ncbi:MAG: pyrroloquinoline quinone biosynthesis protein PqqE [Rhodospirillales bacterium]|nr:pyrroloquinoline quinone biosynthesis protein PqqE [Rhodospirillales bacterium]
MIAPSSSPPPPLALLAEVTHRCPMRCVYCSNPLELVAASGELEEADWLRVLSEAAELGILQVHFSGGEPLARQDLPRLIAHAAREGLYTNLITSGIGLDAALGCRLADAGLEHVQLSVQDTEATGVDRIGGFQGALAHKRRAADAIAAAGLAMTLNAVIHRGNAERIDAFVSLALALGARRLEVAHVQYYGWGLINRAWLMPTIDQLRAVSARVEAARAQHKGALVIDYVIPDYYARLPKSCMGGWGRRFMVVDPAGRALPCHAATTIPDLHFTNVRDASIAETWEHAPAFNAFRGTAWMAEPCRSCDRRELDWGGCRCQALALTGDAAATDPACHKSPHHRAMVELATREASAPPAAAAGDVTYRGSRRRRPRPPAAATSRKAEETCSGF